MKLGIFILLATILSLRTRAQTCEVLIVTSDSIVVGADARTVNKVDVPGTKEVKKVYLNECKIYVVGQRFFMIAGRKIDKNIELAKSLCKSCVSLKEITSQYKTLAKPNIEAMLLQEKKKYPDFYKSHFLRRAAAEIAFFTFENGIAKVSYLIFGDTSRNMSHPVGVDVASFDTTVVNKKYLVHPMGSREAYEELRPQMKSERLFSQGMEEAIRKIIRRQIEMNKAKGDDSVAEPIYILKIFKGNRFKWLDPKPKQKTEG